MPDHLVKELYSKHPKPANQTFTYGTAGFRLKYVSITRAELLDSIMFTVGILAVLRSKAHKGKVIGVMVTASHNPEADNGVKLCEPLGDMLDQSWEEYAIWLANAKDGDELVTKINEIVKICNIDLQQRASVIVGRDTRPSGKALVEALEDGVISMVGDFKDYGIMATPLLHYLTRCLNTQGTTQSYGEPTAEGYYKKLADAYKKIVGDQPKLSPLQVDCANGVGAIALEKLVKEIGNDYLTVNPSQTDVNGKGVLNFECGADFVKMYQKAPKGMDLAPLVRSCSLDGDADRIVFYFGDENGTFRLLDGDKIATLAAGFLMSLIKKANVKHKDGSALKVGLVQTAYANGSSTSYVKNVLQVPVVFTPTGVKHLHHEAAHFDIGVYFEANGHGTVLFSDAAVEAFSQKGDTPEQTKALETLKAFSDLINQTVGDALSDMLMVEAILVSTKQSFADWNKAYTDLPSRQEKVKVKDRTAFVPINADTELQEPKGLQERINAQVSKFSQGRCFVRPSGTEDVVRVYAEAETSQDTELLSQIVCGIVFDYYGGVGDRPTKFKKTDENGNLE